MRQVISVRDLEEMLRNGEDVRAVSVDAILTPSARDFLRDLEDNARARTVAPAAKPAATEDGKPQPPVRPITSRSSQADLIHSRALAQP